MALLSISTNTIMYLLPLCERVGIAPVWSEYIVSLASHTFMYTSLSFFPINCVLLCSFIGLAFVDRLFFLDCAICPFGVSFVSG